MSKFTGFTQQFRSFNSMRWLPVRGSLLLGLIVVVIAGSAPPAAEASTPPPEVTGISPNDGPPAGGTTVQITGSNFTGATAVKFIMREHFEERDAASFIVNSDTSITAVSPPGRWFADVIVVGPSGRSAETPQDRFGYGPVVVEMTPKRGPAAGGTSVTLSGFGLKEATGVTFGASNALSFSEKPDGSITAVSPPVSGGEAGVYVTVTTPEGTSPTLFYLEGGAANEFVYGPTVQEVRHRSGPVLGGSLVTIQGTGFERHWCFCGPFVRAVNFGTASLQCGLPGGGGGICNPVEFTVDSDTEITALVPPGIGTVDVTVETVGGTSPVTPADEYRYEPLPPIVGSEVALDITSSGAILVASVNPGGLEASYRFQIAKHPICPPAPPPMTPCAPQEVVNLPQGSLPASIESQPVSLNLASAGVSLEPGTKYYFRAIASNEAGKGEGASEEFTTLTARCPDSGCGSPPFGHSLYQACVMRARAAFRKARKTTAGEHGKARRTALRHARARERKAMSKCREHFHR